MAVTVPNRRSKRGTQKHGELQYDAGLICLIDENQPFVRSADITTWELSVQALLQSWKANCIDVAGSRDLLLQYMSEDRSSWPAKAEEIAQLCLEDNYSLESADPSKLDGIYRSAYAARMIILHGTLPEQLADKTIDELQRHTYAVRLLLTVTADFQDCANGYFARTLGNPKPHMHTPSGTRHAGTRRGQIHLPEDGDDSSDYLEPHLAPRGDTPSDGSTESRRSRRVKDSTQKAGSTPQQSALHNSDDGEATQGSSERTNKARKSENRSRAQQQHAESEESADSGPDEVSATGAISKRYQLRNPADLIASKALELIEGRYLDANKYWQRQNDSLRQKLAVSDGKVDDFRMKFKYGLNHLVGIKTRAAVARADAAERTLVGVKVGNAAEITQLKAEKLELEREVDRLRAIMATTQPHDSLMSSNGGGAAEMGLSAEPTARSSEVGQDGQLTPHLMADHSHAAPICESLTLGSDNLSETNIALHHPAGMTLDFALGLCLEDDKLAGAVAAIEHEIAHMKREREAAFRGQVSFNTLATDEIERRGKWHSEYRLRMQDEVALRNREIIRLNKICGERGLRGYEVPKLS